MSSRIDAILLQTALVDRRWTALARVGVDLAGIATWDRALDRRTRLLVPVDVQAFVVPRSGGERTVPLTGGGADPAPFAAGSVLPAGVHLHWAMPDALLRGTQPPEGADGLAPPPEFPPLPDRWLVLRALLPNGRAAALLRGWVIDARTGTATPLASFDGTPAAGGTAFDTLDAAFGGSLLWTASYTASAGRFGFHDPLDDLPAAGSAEAPTGVHGSGAVYTVAGWWSDLAQDPLAGSVGQRHLDERLAELGWHVVHDASDDVHDEEDTRIARMRSSLGLTSPGDATVRVSGASGALDKVEHAPLRVTVPVKHAESVLVGPARPRYATLLHGAVLGVPLNGPAGADDRPTATSLSLSLGADLDDVVAAFGAAALGTGASHRAAAERLTAAFTSDMLERLGTTDGLADLAEREHADGFASMPGAPLPNAHADRLRGEDAVATGPSTVGRKARGKLRAAGVKQRTKLQWRQEVELGGRKTGKRQSAPAVSEVEEPASPAAELREVKRPAPRWFFPEPPMLAIRGAKPNHRHHGDGLYDDQGRLRCRYPRECATEWEGVVAGAVVVPSIGSGAVPAEVLPVVRESVLLNPYAYDWLAAAGAAATGGAQPRLNTRLAAEMVRLYGADGRYDGLTHIPQAQPKAAASSWDRLKPGMELSERQLTAELARFSVLKGSPPSPVAITTWRQPWVPLWLEWEVALEGSDTVDGWTLEGLDLEQATDAAATTSPITLTCRGRSPVGRSASRSLHAGIRRWLEAEVQRDASGQSALDAGQQEDLRRLGEKLAPLDLVSASLNGVREQLLGLDWEGTAVEGEADAAGETKPVASRLPVPLFGGTLRVVRLRLVDAFGRVLDVPAASAITTSTLEVDGLAAGMRLRPRVQHAARWLFRLVDPALPPEADAATAREAFVDQVEPQLAVNPIAGYLLPDHIDEALEFFDVRGQPLGELAHDALSGAVTWEPAPGRPLPPDAGPLAGLDAHARLAGEIASGVVQADVAARDAGATTAGSALATLLRAVDTALWSVDTFGAVGTASVAGLVGRPIAVVRATLRLDVPDDIEMVSTADPDARRAAFQALHAQRFPLQLGAIERADDALLGFFVDDDYRHLHLVDRVVAAQARESGRHRGQLGLLGDVTDPAVEPLSHPFLVPEDVLWVRPGQTLRLTLLMLPAGKVHLTSGILPRKALALAEDWVTPGLTRVMPSVRVGPVLVDPTEIRLPLVRLLGDKQTFTRRTGPLTWRDDPIVAATQAALLPRMPHEVQEGWIRVTPEEPEDGE